jgi:hypothetical protein
MLFIVASSTLSTVEVLLDTVSLLHQCVHWTTYRHLVTRAQIILPGEQ